jgi:hypothetical protein
MIFVFFGLELFVVNYLVKFGVIYSFVGSIVVIGVFLILVALTGDKPNFAGIKGKNK